MEVKVRSYRRSLRSLRAWKLEKPLWLVSDAVNPKKSGWSTGEKTKWSGSSVVGL
jgi:hypothetical protein